MTALETLEHIPDWKSVLQKLIDCTRTRLVVSVPYRERITKTICIHCAKETPLYGHLHVFNESTFPNIYGWQLRIGYIYDRGLGSTIARRIYRTIRPHKGWLVAVYDREHPEPGF